MLRATSLVITVAALLPLHASVIGTSKPAESLTEARILTLPAAQQRPWLDYLKRSRQQMAADKAALAAERVGLAQIPPLPRQGYSARAMPLHREPAFYSTPEARHIGDIIVSFQIPSGGWSKNLAMTEPRLKGQIYATGNQPPTPPANDDFDKPLDETWHYIGTFDNDATNTELHFLAELCNANPGPAGAPYRASLLRGIDYLLKAQFPNGGWPQVYPLEGGYHDAITYNDDAVTESAQFLSDVASGGRHFIRGEDASISGVPSNSSAIEDFSFVPALTRAKAKAAVAKALECILATQLKAQDGPDKPAKLAVWAQQNDPLTLLPVSGRNYEPEALASGESASVLEYLMTLYKPSPAVVRSIDSAAAWFESHKIMGYTYGGGRNTPGGRKLTASPGAGPLWARYYSLTTGKPIFGDRDKSIHDELMEISLERRNGYGWYGNGPYKVLAEYEAWKKNLAPKPKSPTK